jgi:succinyl-CoA synthetase beta subunit
VAFIASTEGGVNIEEVAVKTPEKITTLTVDPASGLWPFHTRIIASALKLEGDQAKQCARLVSALYRLFLDKDASLIEINPLVVTKDGKLICLDAKIGFDDNAVFRHPDIEALRDFDQEEPAEVEAQRLGLSYVKLDGTIGCMVNGAGLAMTTMDLVKRAGGEPANFLDIGGGARADKVTEAMRLILADPRVDAILVNIFGGITRGDEVARGLIDARAQQTRDVPMVVRIVGTNAAEAAALLQEARFETATSLDDAATKAVAASRGAAS